jgi:hypothetical protein
MLGFLRRRCFGGGVRCVQGAQYAADARKLYGLTKRVDVGYLSWISCDATILNAFVVGNGMFHNSKSV